MPYLTYARAGLMLVLVSVLLAADQAQEAELRVKQGEETATVLRDERPVMVYQHRPNDFKPYVKALYTPGGVQPLRDRPHDHIHHHALMFAFRVDGETFWNEYPKERPGRQQPRRDEAVAVLTSRGQARLEQTLDWIDHAGTRRLVEERAITVYGVVDQATLLTWQSQLSPPKDGAVTLTGSHYAGMGMRFVQGFDGKAAFVHASGKAGKVFRGDERLTPGPWCAVHGAVGDKKVTVAMFDHPDNPRASAVWFTMSKPFAYLSATLKLHEKALEIAADESLALRYGVALWDGHVDAAAVDQMRKQWLKVIGSMDVPSDNAHKPGT